MVLHAGMYTYRVRHSWDVLSGRTTAADYLSRFQRSFQGYDYLARTIQPGEKVFNSAEHAYFYSTLEKMVINNSFFRRSLALQGSDLKQHLSQKNYEYIWLLRGSDEELFDYARQKGYEPVYSYRFVEKPATYDYIIFKKTG